MAVLEKISLEEVASSFDDHGFPLFMEERRHYSIGIEEAIISSLFMSAPRLYDGIPVLLSKNKINYKKLKNLIDEYNLWNEFGFFGEFALTHLENKRLRRLVEYCHKNLKSSSILYPFEIEFSKKFQKAEEKKWNILGAPSYEELEDQFEVYANE